MAFLYNGPVAYLDYAFRLYHPNLIAYRIDSLDVGLYLGIARVSEGARNGEKVGSTPIWSSKYGAEYGYFCTVVDV